MQASPYLESESVDAFDDRLGAADRTRRPVETREKAVSGRVDFSTTEADELATHDRVMTLEQITPCPVSEIGCSLARADDVGEQHRRQHAIRLGCVPVARLDLRDESFQLGEDRILVADLRSEVPPRQLDEPRPRNMIREVAAATNVDRDLGPMQHQRWHPDLWEHCADVHIEV